jgi:hydrogenase maturation protease
VTVVGPLVICYGNDLRGDDGVGPVAAAAMAGDVRFADVTVLSAHQLTPELADDVSRANRLVVVDAICDDKPPGTVTVTPLAAETGDSSLTHHVSPGAILGLVQVLHGWAPPATAVTVSVADLDGGGLTPGVAAAVPHVLDVVAGLVLSNAGASGA